MTSAAPEPDVSAIPRRSPAALIFQHPFAISIAAAVLLNGLAIGAFAAASARGQAPTRASGQVSWITAVTHARISHEQSSVHSTALPRAPVLPEPTLQPLPHPPAPAVPKALLATSEADNPARFYRSSEVDRPAAPDSDWNLDTALLDAAGVETLVFEIFIDRSGEVVGCAILEPSTLGAAARHAIEARLSQTLLQPAMRAGIAVASVRRIEVTTRNPTP